MIEVKHISKLFGALQVLKEINVTINNGEIATIVGPSGAGKTTLLQIIGTLLKPSEGMVSFDGIMVNSLKDKQLARFRNKNIGFVFQFHHLLPEFTALENVCIPAFIAKVPKWDAEKKAKDIMKFLKLEQRMDHKPNELSGGEQQRVAVARALINNPSVVLADEPSGNLDTVHKTELHELFFNLRDEFKQTFVIVTHDKDLAGMSDRMLQMKDGMILN